MTGTRPSPEATEGRPVMLLVGFGEAVEPLLSLLSPVRLDFGFLVSMRNPRDG